MTQHALRGLRLAGVVVGALVAALTALVGVASVTAQPGWFLAAGLTLTALRWRRVRDQVRTAVQQHGYDRRRGIFTQAFGTSELDAALLQLPALGFVDWCDPRMLRTTDAVAATLGRDGLVRRYLADDGLAGGEGAFLACTFWLAECLARQGRLQQARTWFARAAATANDLGLLAEQVDPHNGELLGNFPQGLSHLAPPDRRGRPATRHRRRRPPRRHAGAAHTAGQSDPAHGAHRMRPTRPQRNPQAARSSGTQHVPHTPDRRGRR
jgi:Glycosyl hydrolases family 15